MSYMNKQTLLELLERLRTNTKESTTVEFKTNLSDPRVIGEYISALANSAALDGHDRAWMVWELE